MRHFGVLFDSAGIKYHVLRLDQRHDSAAWRGELPFLAAGPEASRAGVAVIAVVAGVFLTFYASSKHASSSARATVTRWSCRSVPFFYPTNTKHCH